MVAALKVATMQKLKGMCKNGLLNIILFDLIIQGS